MNNLHVTDHPLVESKLTMLRDKNTGNKEFRELVREIAMFICYEATRDAPLEEKQIETPISKTTARTSKRKYAIVPIMRAGLGMVDGVSQMLPTAKIGHIGMFRHPETLEAVEYYFKLPPDAEEREILLLDPLLATGGTAVASIDFLKREGINRIKFLTILVAPEGYKRLTETHPDVMIYTATVDECLNDHKYIVPGLGDAGDRLFGTK
jgi:uracil phosphoribosyltransferase